MSNGGWCDKFNYRIWHGTKKGGGSSDGTCVTCVFYEHLYSWLPSGEEPDSPPERAGECRSWHHLVNWDGVPLNKLVREGDVCSYHKKLSDVTDSDFCMEECDGEEDGNRAE